MKSLLYILVCFLGFFLLTNCTDDADIVNPPLPSFCESGRNDPLFSCFRTGIFNLKASITQNSIFPSTNLIEIPPYTYPAPANPSSSLGNIIEVSGDQGIQPFLDNSNCCNIQEMLDRFPTTPILQWNTTSSPLVAVAIFESQVEISPNGNKIQNIDNIVWTWNTGMGGQSQSGGKTIVDFASGKDVQNGEIKITTTDLEQNKVYVWAVWAWNTTGTIVSLSSRAIPFVVETLPSIGFTSLEQFTFAEGTWNIRSATVEASNINITDDFPVQGFKIDLNCEEETMTENPTYFTFPENLTGAIANPVENRISLGSIEFFDISFPCDERLLGKANYNDELINLIYEIE